MIKENIRKIRGKIREVAEISGRKGRDVTIIAASKTFNRDNIIEAIDSGINDFGENYVQEAEKKLMGLDVTKHMIGHLQTNKVKKALEIFDVIQTLDSLKLAKKIDEEAKNLSKIVPVLVEVNAGKEKSKFGIFPADTADFLKELGKFRKLDVIGLMTMARKEHFALMKKLFDSSNLRYLSMGMSKDYPEAIINGANMIRLGRAIFGERK